MLDPRDLTHDFVKELATDALRQDVGFRKTVGVSALAEKTGDAERNVMAHHQGENLPRLDAVLRYTAVLGSRYLSRMLAPLGLTVIPIESGLTVAPSAYDIAGHMAEEAGVIIRMLEDKQIDEREARELARRIPELRDKLINFESALNRRLMPVAAAE